MRSGPNRNDTLKQRIRQALGLCLRLACGLILAIRLAAAEPMLPGVYHGQVEISGWLMSEKLDGVRGYWDGSRLWSKHRQRLYPPTAFTSQLPPFPLEGELWAGRGRFEQTVAIVSRQQPHDGWLQLSFAIFDVPEAPGPFTRRIATARDWLTRHPSPHAFVIHQQPVRDPDHLEQELQRIEALGGEGLIVRNPAAGYVAGRSPEILKVKNYQDAEATVLAHLPGAGRHAGRLGALLVELEDGRQCKIGTGFSDAERDSPPPVGTRITFKYYGNYQSGLPRFPSYLRIRGDQGL